MPQKAPILPMLDWNKPERYWSQSIGNSRYLMRICIRWLEVVKVTQLLPLKNLAVLIFLGRKEDPIGRLIYLQMACCLMRPRTKPICAKSFTEWVSTIRISLLSLVLIAWVDATWTGLVMWDVVYFNSAWTYTPERFSNQYYKLLLSVKWELKKWDGYIILLRT
jgi:hypothetical protein